MAQTNYEIIKAVIDADTSLAGKLQGVDPSDNADVYQFLTDTSANTVPLMNEFLNILMNKVVVQRLFDPLSFRNPFNRMFMREIEPFGDLDEFISVDANQGTDYTETSTLLTVEKGPAYVDHLYTKYRRRWKISFSFEILRGAFLEEYKLSALIDQYTKKMRDKLEIEMYNQTVTDLATYDWDVGQKVTIPRFDTASIRDTSQAAYSAILNAANAASLPNTTFMNTKKTSMVGNIPLGTGYLVLYYNAKTNFDVNVVASLFNSAEIGTNRYFRDVTVINDVEGRNDSTTTAGYILSADSYNIIPRIDMVTSFFDASNMINHNYLHHWRKQGVNPLVEAIRLDYATA